eukprot:Platyproteum_vivax@DN933_c0_g1_i1.p1
MIGHSGIEVEESISSKILAEHATQEAMRAVDWSQKEIDMFWIHQQDFCDTLQSLIKSNTHKFANSTTYETDVQKLVVFVMGMEEHLANELVDFSCSKALDDQCEEVLVRHVRQAIVEDPQLKLCFGKIIQDMDTQYSPDEILEGDF